MHNNNFRAELVFKIILIIKGNVGIVIRKYGNTFWKMGCYLSEGKRDAKPVFFASCASRSSKTAKRLKNPATNTTPPTLVPFGSEAR